MRVDLQYATLTPRKSTTIDSSEWAALPKKTEPAGSEVIDEAAGWFANWNIQGNGAGTPDHVAMEDQSDGSLKCWVWNDDPEDYPDGRKFGSVQIFRPAFIHPDPKHRGKYHYEQTFTVYAEPNTPHWKNRAIPKQNMTVRPWSEFPFPGQSLTMHGVWLRDDHYLSHQDRQSRCKVHEWLEDLPDEEIVKINGVYRLRPQGPLGRFRKEHRSIRYTLRDDARASTITHTSPNFENAMETSGGTPAGQESQNYSGGGARSEWVWSSPSGSPNDGAWPTDDYFGTFTVLNNSAPTEFEYGMRDAGGAEGHIARVNSALSSDLETKQQTEALFTGTGDKDYSTGSVSWTAGAAGDRAEVVMAVTRTTNHGNETIEIEQNAANQQFFEGPWDAPARRAPIVIQEG